MKQNLAKGLLMLCAFALLVSCSSSKKQSSQIGKVVIVKESKVANKDNGLHKGWYKNPNNPHHPRTTNPGHTKSDKGKPASNGKAAKSKKK